MGRIVTFGELMYRIISPIGERLFQSPNFTIIPGGAEANVAVSLAQYGDTAAFVTALPQNMIGNALIRELKALNVDTSEVIRKGNRVGLYFTEAGSNMRPSKVIYDREGSAAAEVKPDSYNWRRIVDKTDWFHTTGITPAISENACTAALQALKTCKELGITVSCDLNFRKNLWNWGKRASEVMPQITRMTDFLIANEEDCQMCLGITHEEDAEKGEISEDSYRELGRRVLWEYPNLKGIAFSLRTSISADHNRWAGLLVTGDSSYASRTYDITDIVDRVGGGDAFGAGLIHGLKNFNDTRKIIEFAAAASALKQTIHGDFNRFTEEEVMGIVKGNTTGRIQR